ncbi:unnamed protein product [Urochloa humidicola]
MAPALTSSPLPSPPFIHRIAAGLCRTTRPCRHRRPRLYLCPPRLRRHPWPRRHGIKQEEEQLPVRVLGRAAAKLDIWASLLQQKLLIELAD